MLNSFKERLLRTIEQLQQQKPQVIEALQGLSYQQLAVELVHFSDAKSVQTLLSVLESDFDMQQDNIQSLYSKLEHIKRELNKQQGGNGKDEAPRTNTVHIQPYLKQQQLEAFDDDNNEFLKEQALEPLQVSPTVDISQVQSRPPMKLPRRTKITRQLLHKQKLKTDVDPHMQSFTQQKVLTEASQDQHYYSEQKVQDWRHIDGAELHWERVFQHYHKLPLGILKQNSFEERSQSYKTMNYEKILAFLTDAKLNLTADGRLTIIKVMRKHALNHKFITKSEFKDIYEELCSTLNVRDEQIHQLLTDKEATMANPRDLSRRKIISVQRTIESLTRKDPSKTRNRRAVVLPYQRQKIQRTYTSSAAEKLKIKQLTWQVLFNLSDASLFVNAHVPAVDLNRGNEDEDSYYLQEYYNKKDDKKSSPIKELSRHTKTKTVLPVIRSRMTPLRPH